MELTKCFQTSRQKKTKSYSYYLSAKHLDDMQRQKVTATCIADGTSREDASSFLTVASTLLTEWCYFYFRHIFSAWCWRHKNDPGFRSGSDGKTPCLQRYLSNLYNCMWVISSPGFFFFLFLPEPRYSLPGSTFKIKKAFCKPCYRSWMHSLLSWCAFVLHVFIQRIHFKGWFQYFYKQ